MISKKNCDPVTDIYHVVNGNVWVCVCVGGGGGPFTGASVLSSYFSQVYELKQEYVAY